MMLLLEWMSGPNMYCYLKGKSSYETPGITDLEKQTITVNVLWKVFYLNIDWLEIPIPYTGLKPNQLNDKITCGWYELMEFKFMPGKVKTISLELLFFIFPRVW